MPLYALTDADEITTAYERFAERLQDGSAPYIRSVGWRGGGEQHTVHWHPGIELWGLNDAPPSGYWFGFGTNDPAEASQFGSIVVQFSFYREGTSRRCGGLFARDDADGQTHLLHSGGIGGGKPGISKIPFLASYAGPLTNVTWLHGPTVQYCALGPLDAPDLLGRIAAFSQAVQTFKNSVAAGAGSGT